MFQYVVNIIMVKVLKEELASGPPLVNVLHCKLDW